MNKTGRSAIGFGVDAALTWRGCGKSVIPNHDSRRGSRSPRRQWKLLHRAHSLEEEAVRIYLDMCCLKRPFDDQLATRVQVETQAVEAILILCRDGRHELIASAALRFENGKNPNADRKAFADDLLDLARH